MSENIVELESNDIVKDNIEKLKQLFPDIVSDGKIDFDKLKTILGNEVETDSESYKFEWVGKKNCYKTIQTPSNGTLKYIEKDSLNPDIGENIIIEGDNLEVLKLLQPIYGKDGGQIKVIYIDPPYNTGNEFIYPDSFDTPMDNYLEITGQKINGEDTQSKKSKEGRRHTQWLNMIFPRLLLSRTLLKNDGVIFISIDDNEVDNLKRLCDEVFGEENLVGLISRGTGTTTGQDGGKVGSSLDYLLIYKKSEDYVLQGIPLSEKDELRFKEEDSKGKYSLLQLRKTGNSDRREDRPFMYYGIKNPNGDTVYPIGPTGYESRWRVGEPKYNQWLKEDLIVWKENNKGILTPYVKYYLENRTKQVSNLWTELDGNKKGSIELKNVLGEKVFNNPKPKDLIRKILQISTSTDTNDIVLDFFGGSGTTGQTVLEMNKEDGGNRKFILVQLQEPLSPTNKEQKVSFDYLTNLKKPTVISEITKERIRRVINGYGDNPQPINDGFKVFKLDNSNYKINEKINVNRDNKEEVIKQLRQYFRSGTNDYKERFVDNYKEEDIIYENIVKEGYNLNSKIELVENIDPYTVYKITDSVKKDKKFYITFDKVDIDIKLKKEFMGISNDTLFICIDHLLSDSDKDNLKDTFQLKTL